MKRYVNIAISLKLFKKIQEEKSNDICIADEVEYVVDRLITYKREVI